MEVIRKETAYEGEFLRIVRKTCRTESDGEVVWETVERTNIHGVGVMAVVAMTVDREMIMERQWRAAIESFVIQFPAGLMDKEDESSEEAAKRELLEETGYSAKRLVPILTAPTNPVLAPLSALYYYAPEVEYTGNKNRDIAEEMEIITVPKDKLDEFLLNIPDDTELDLRVPGIIRMLEAKGLI